MEIRVQYQGTPNRSTLEKPKKKVPPSKITPIPPPHTELNKFNTDPRKIQKIEEGDIKRQIDSENKENWSKTEKTEGMMEIAEDTEAWPEDEPEDHLEDEPEDGLEDKIAENKATEVKKFEMASPFNGYAWDGPPRRGRRTSPPPGHLPAGAGSLPLLPPWTPKPAWRDVKEDIPRPCTSSVTEHAADAELPVRTVRVPAHQASDRKFVTVRRKRRIQKEYQTDCKTS